MARKITTSTDKYGRTVYKITGTKKYAFSLAKAKKIAASLDGGAVRKPAKKTVRKTTRRPAKRTTALARVRKPAKRTTAKRNASGQFVKRTAAKKTTRRNPLGSKLVQETAEYDVHGTFWTEGRKVRRGHSIGTAIGKADALRIAQEYLEDQGISKLVFREDNKDSIMFRPKAGSGIIGSLEAYPMDDREILQGAAKTRNLAMARASLAGVKARLARR